MGGFMVWLNQPSQPVLQRLDMHNELQHNYVLLIFLH